MKVFTLAATVWLLAADLPALDGAYEGPGGRITIDLSASTVEAIQGNCLVAGQLKPGKGSYTFVARSTDGGCAELAKVVKGQPCAALIPTGIDARRGLANGLKFKATSPGCKPFNGKYELN